MKGYKTILFNILAAVLPILDAADVTHILSPSGVSVYTVIVSVSNILLRFYTTSPIFKKNVPTT